MLSFSAINPYTNSIVLDKKIEEIAKQKAIINKIFPSLVKKQSASFSVDKSSSDVSSSQIPIKLDINNDGKLNIKDFYAKYNPVKSFKSIVEAFNSFSNIKGGAIVNMMV
ncbi:hypothetical protein MCHI_003970 [Candidatus Magnetoovum chiemensis]|nr:hypothetical protein MCHI_003970 [Candidatus Magnetoovum chiemensis]